MEVYEIFETREDFRNWLFKNCMLKDGIWIYFSKSGKQLTLKAKEALEEALCFGWIDGQMKSIDNDGYIKYFSLRRKNSKWSEKNKTIVAELENKGFMTEFGRDKIKEAKENGQWNTNNTVVVEEDEIALLTNELIGIEPAYTNFLSMSQSVKITYVKAFKDPKTIEGKQKRLSWIIDRLNKNLKPM